MNTQKQDRIAQDNQPEVRAKKPYAKPAILQDLALEATASACSTSPGKTVPGSGGCTVGFS